MIWMGVVYPSLAFSEQFMTSLGHHFADPRLITEIKTDTPGDIGKPWRNVVDLRYVGCCDRGSCGDRNEC